MNGIFHDRAIMRKEYFLCIFCFNAEETAPVLALMISVAKRVSILSARIRGYGIESL